MKNEKTTRTAKATKVKDFTNEDDVKSSDGMTRDGSHIIKFNKDEKAPIYLLKSQFTDGYAHWVPVPSGDVVRVPCVGGAAGGGRAPDECPICKYVGDLYKQASQARGGKSDALRQKASKMRGSYEIYFIAAKGSTNIVKLEGNKRTTKVEFDNPQVGVLRLTKAQYTTLRGLPTKFDYITSNKDLFNRYIMVDKQVRNDDDYASIEFIPAKKPTERPDVEIPEDVDISELFEIDMKLAKSTLALHLSDTDGDDDEGVDYEDDEEDGVDAKKKTHGKPSKGHGKVVEDDDDEDDLEDDTDDAEDFDDDDTDVEDDEEEDDESDDESDDEDDSDDEEEVEDSDDDDTESFDDDFLDDVDADFDDEEEGEEDDAPPALPKKGKKTAAAPSRKAAKEPEKPKAKKHTEEPKKPARGRPAKAVEAEKPAAKRGRKPAVAAEPPKKRGRPAKAAPAPAKKGKR